MGLKQQICQAFCQGVEVSTFKGGLAISTHYMNRVGDRIGMYAMGPTNGLYRIVDNALTIAMLAAEGATLDNQGRRAAVAGLLSEYRAGYDDEMGEVFIEDVPETDLPRRILDFSALLLRLNDIALLTPERVESTFKEDVKQKLRDQIGDRAIITEDEPVSDNISEVTPDMVFRAKGRDPVALFIATSETRLWQAMHLRMIADYERHVGLSIVAMLEADNSVGQKVRIQADNRLVVPRYRSEPGAAIQRVVREVLGNEQTVH